MSLESFLYFVSGSLVTWFFAWLYYAKSSKDLGTGLKTLSSSDELIMAQADLNAKGIKTDLKRNSDGKVIGIYANMEASLSGSSKMSVTGTLTDGSGS